MALSRFDDEVSGIIIGGEYGIRAALYYDGRRQGGDIFADNEEVAMAVAVERKREALKACGLAVRDIYPLDAWELRIYDE